MIMNSNVVVPSDHIVNGVKIEEENVANFDGVFDEGLDDSGIKSSEQEQRCREIELEIRNKERNLVTIISKIRVLGGEKLRVEEEIKGLKEKKAVLIGAKENALIIMTPKNKRKRDLVVTSDYECEDYECTPSRRVLKLENNDDDDDGEGEDGGDDVTPTRRGFKRVDRESESDDDESLPISHLLSSKIARESSERASPLNPTRPRRRRLVKCGQDELKDKPQKIGNLPDTLTSENVADDHDSSENDSESSDRSLGSFIVDDSDCEDVKDDASKESSGDDSDDDSEEEVSDTDLNFKEILSRLQSRRHPNSKWVSEADMLSDFGKNPELCMKAVCALYRLQTNEEKACKASIVHNGRGFSTSDATRGTFLGEFLTDGVPNGNGDMVKTVEELQEHHPTGVEDCRSLANRYSKQLFKIYESGDDPYFL